MKLSLLFVLTTCFNFGHSIRCYHCNSVNNSMCLNPAQYNKVVRHLFLKPIDCDNGQNTLPDQRKHFCRKIVQTILHKEKTPEVRVTRGCGWVKYKSDCYKSDTEDHLETACQCFSDECNSASTAAVSWVTAVLTLLCLYVVLRQ